MLHKDITAPPTNQEARQEKTHIKILLPPQPTKRQDKREVDMNECYRKTHIKILLPPQPTKRQDKREVDMNECYRKTHIKILLPPPTNQEARQERGRHE